MKDTDISMAYLLLVHKNPEQVNMFISQLLNYDGGNCGIYIHVDKKSQEICGKLHKDERVHVCSKYDVGWGSVEIVKAAVELMRMAVDSEARYSHISLGSGSDFMVRPGLYDYLACHRDRVFLHIEREILNNSRAAARYKVRWPKFLMIRNDYHIYRFIRIIIQLFCKCGVVFWRNNVVLKHQLRMYEGHTWFIAPTEAIRYILNYIDQNKDYMDFWQDSLASDLMVFQTLLMNSIYKNKISEELMYVNFGKTFGTMNHPLTITKGTIPEIEAGNYFLARKFELYEDSDSIKYYLRKTNVMKD